MPSPSAIVRATCLALLALPLAGPAARAAEPAERIVAEAARLLAVPVAAGDDAGARAEAERVLRRVQPDAAAGRVYLALEDLGRGRGLLRAMAEISGNAAAGKDQAQFAAYLERTAPGVRAGAAKARERDWGMAPLAVRALAESAAGKSLTLLEASGAYAKVTSPQAGLFYLGQAQSGLELAEFCAGVGLAAHAGADTTAFPRSIKPAIDGIQKRTEALFVPPLSIDRHSDFIRLNATIKLAGELDAAGLVRGAAYQYLDAEQQLALLAAKGPAPDAAALRTKLAELRERLAARHRDDSLAELFLERADAVLAGPETPGGAPVAQAVAEQVVPAYFALLATPERPPQESVAAASVTVTLVRWPYT